MLNVLVSCRNVLRRGPRQKVGSVRPAARGFASRSGPINPSRFSASAKKTPPSGLGAHSTNTSGAGGGIFDFASITQTPKPGQDEISTRAVNPQNMPKRAKEEASSKPEQGGTSGNLRDDLRPKTIKRIADTDWYLVTSVSNKKYFFNRKTKESASKLPPSVAEHLGRLYVQSENDLVAQNPADLASATSSTSQASKQTHAPDAHQISEMPAAQRTQAPKSPSAPSPAPKSPSSVPPTSILRQPGSTTSQQPSTAEPVAETRPARKEVHIHPTFSIRESVKKHQANNYANVESELQAQAPIKSFTAEERAARRKELDAEWLKQGYKERFDITDEELDVLLSEEAYELEMQAKHERGELSADDVLIGYTSRLPHGKAASKASSPLDIDRLDETNYALTVQADRMLARGEAKKVIDLFTSNSSKQENKLHNGVVLTLRERSTVLTSLLVRCRAHILRHEWSAAEKCVQTAMLVDPSHPYALLCKALYHISQDEMSPGLRTIDEALAADPKNPLALRLMAECYLDLEEVPTAAEVVKDLIKAHPKDYQALLLKMRIEVLGGDMKAASRVLNEAFAVAPERPEAYVQEAILFAAIEDYDNSLGSAAKALDLDKNHGPAFSILGRVFLTKSMFDDAKMVFKASLSVDEFNTEALLGLSTVAFEQQNYQEMLVYASRATKADSSAIEAWFQKGRAEFELKQWNSAVESFKEVIAMDPRAEEAYLLLGGALHGAGRTAECLERMEQLLAINPKSVKAHINKGFAYNTQGKAQEALKAFDAALALDASDTEAKLGRMSALLALGRSEEAQTYLASFRHEAPQDAYDAAVKLANQTQAADQAAAQRAQSDASSNVGASGASEEMDEGLQQDLAHTMGMADEAMQFNPQDMFNMNEDDLRRMLGGDRIDQEMALTPEDFARDMENEVTRVNEILGRVGLSKVDLNNPDAMNNMPDVEEIDPSKVDPAALQDYVRMVTDLRDYAQKQRDNPEQHSPEEWEALKRTGLTPQLLQELRDRGLAAPVGLDKKTAQKQFDQEFDKFSTKATKLLAQAKYKRSTKKTPPL